MILMLYLNLCHQMTDVQTLLLILSTKGVDKTAMQEQRIQPQSLCCYKDHLMS